MKLTAPRNIYILHIQDISRNEALNLLVQFVVCCIRIVQGGWWNFKTHFVIFVESHKYFAAHLGAITTVYYNSTYCIYNNCLRFQAIKNKTLPQAFFLFVFLNNMMLYRADLWSFRWLWRHRSDIGEIMFDTNLVKSNTSLLVKSKITKHL